MANCKIDILSINETKLDSSVSNSEISQATMLLEGIVMLMTEIAVESLYIYEIILISPAVKL